MTYETILGEVIAKANHYMAVPDKATGGRRMIKDQILRAYEKEFDKQCKLYRGKQINQPFRFLVNVYYSHNNHDIDNSLKTILDCLQYAGAITNDNLCMEIQAKKYISQYPRIEYAIEPIQPTLFD